ncbi:hypothetical protein RRG08_027245 [Elysia crispata]|uniref:Apextrin C-terminal domain-containing protein n=1 Tax=Elysia crispata TaxID=231223 RepID=A0AAE0ZTX5_9GAST|nr:hypothetical protein RRG08_027245 [Elysia crispata]
MEPGFILICLLSLTSTTVGDQVANTTNSVFYGGDFHSFALTYTSNGMYEGIADRVELRCARNAVVESGIRELLWMRILMFSPDHGWRVLAEQRNEWSQPESHGKVSSSGKMAPVGDSYLSLVWTNPSDRVIGSYKCLILGLNQHLSFVVDETPIVEIKAKKISEEALLDTILDTEDNIRRQANSNSKEISNTAGKLDAHPVRSEQRFQAANGKIDKANLTVASVMSDFLFPKEVWPAGTYALPKPESGCPADMAFYEGDTGYFTLHTESSSNLSENGHSKNSHLSRPILTSYSINNFLTLRFCVANGMYNSGAWPSGRYCIHKKGSCPGGLKIGYITFKTAALGNLDAAGGNKPENSPSTMYFCCMTSGCSTTPIFLPTAHPFYLYKHDGRCQKVKGMEVTEEYVQVHTEPGSAASSYHPYLPTDSSGRLVRLQLCYYTKY